MRAPLPYSGILRWSELPARWQAAFGTPMPPEVRRVWGPAFYQCSDEQLRALGFLYASGDLKPYRVDLNAGGW